MTEVLLAAIMFILIVIAGELRGIAQAIRASRDSQPGGPAPEGAKE